MSDRSQKGFRKVGKSEKSYISVPSGGNWMPLWAPMLESPAFRVLSRAAQMCLWRVSIANCITARFENGRLAVTFDDFVEYGVNRKQIGDALAELYILGFLERTHEGQRAYGSAPGVASEYRLTFEGTIGTKAGHPTHDWRRFETMEQARKAQAAAIGKKSLSVKKPTSNVVDFRRNAA